MTIFFKGKPKTKAEQKKEILEEVMSDIAFEKHSDNEEVLKILCSDLPIKTIGSENGTGEVKAGERFIYNDVPYKAISAHVLTIHHNPETAGTNLYENILPKNEKRMKKN